MTALKLSELPIINFAQFTTPFLSGLRDYSEKQEILKIQRQGSSSRVAVLRGAELLDQRGPENWTRRIDVRQLNIADPNRCVLGQCYGGYGRALVMLGLNHDTDSEYFGFTTPLLPLRYFYDRPLVTPAQMQIDWQELSMEWARFIAERQATDGAEQLVSA